MYLAYGTLNSSFIRKSAKRMAVSPPAPVATPVLSMQRTYTLAEPSFSSAVQAILPNGCAAFFNFFTEGKEKRVLQEMKKRESELQRNRTRPICQTMRVLLYIRGWIQLHWHAG